jgi:hypothetical protein
MHGIRVVDGQKSDGEGCVINEKCREDCEIGDRNLVLKCR